MKGIFQHCSEAHLDRYLNELDFRYSNRAALNADENVDDCERATRAIKDADPTRFLLVGDWLHLKRLVKRAIKPLCRLFVAIGVIACSHFLIFPLTLTN